MPHTNPHELVYHINWLILIISYEVLDVKKSVHEHFSVQFLYI